MAKQPTIAKLRKELWENVKEYVKARDGWVCITCGKDITNPKDRHAGHFIPKQLGIDDLSFNIENVFVQCLKCNKHRGGWGERYAEILEERFGRAYVDNLRLLRDHSKYKWDREQYNTEIARVRRLCDSNNYV